MVYVKDDYVCNTVDRKDKFIYDRSINVPKLDLFLDTLW